MRDILSRVRFLIKKKKIFISTSSNSEVAGGGGKEIVFATYMGLFKYTALFLLLAGGVQAAGAAFSDLAVLLAKGYFGDYVKQDASLEQCVAFLGSRGIRFSLFDLVDTSKAVTKEDLARAVGQSELLFSGEAEIENGNIKKPSEVETWVDYCLLNDINSQPIWDRFVQRTANGSCRK